jgi:hypothetical protein
VIFTIKLVINGKTRWSSVFPMVKSGELIPQACSPSNPKADGLLALKLRDALELYQIRWQKPKNDPRHRDLTKDFHDAEGWAELQRFRDFLEPFYILTKTMEGNANREGK